MDRGWRRPRVITGGYSLRGRATGGASPLTAVQWPGAGRALGAEVAWSDVVGAFSQESFVVCQLVPGKCLRANAWVPVSTQTGWTRPRFAEYQRLRPNNIDTVGTLFGAVFYFSSPVTGYRYWILPADRLGSGSVPSVPSEPVKANIACTSTCRSQAVVYYF